MHQALRLFVSDIRTFPFITDRLTKDDGGLGQIRREHIGVPR